MIGIDLSGQIALVTGASRGIGRAIALAMARAGADLALNYRRSAPEAVSLAQEIAALGRQAEPIEADVAEPEAVEKLFQHVQDRFGQLDVLVNNAGIVRDQLVGGMSLADWDQVLGINLRGAFLCTRAAVSLMIPRQSGKIVNLGSVAALRSSRGQANYAAAKGGLLAFTRACAVELAPKGIQVNAVVPGMIETDMSARVRRRAGEQLLQEIPAGRFGQPEEVARVAVFLASSWSDYLTGQAVVVDGGLSVS